MIYKAIFILKKIIKKKTTEHLRFLLSCVHRNSPSENTLVAYINKTKCSKMYINWKMKKKLVIISMKNKSA